MSSQSLRRCRSSLRPLIEPLEKRQLLAGDFNAGFALPYILDFDRGRGGIIDRDGTGTGFTWVQPNRDGTEYNESLIDLRTGAGVLRVTSSGNALAGSNFEADNSLVNILTTRFAASSKAFIVSARVIGDLAYIDTLNEQGGILFGPDQDNFVKLTVAATSEGVGLQFLDEQRFKSGYKHSLPQTITSIGSLANISTLDLYLAGDPATGYVTAFYRLNGGALIQVPGTLILKDDKRSAFFNNAGFAGIMVQNKSDTGPIAMTFDQFALQRGKLVRQSGGQVSISSRKIFNDVRGGGGQTVETAVKNSGSGPLKITGISLSGTDASKFTFTAGQALPVTLAPGESYPLTLSFSAPTGTALDIKTASMSISSDDPTTPVKNVRLRGLATAGTGGTNEPSLQRLFDLYEIPVIVGDSNPSDVFLDNPAQQPNDEIALQSLRKAGPGPVTIQTIGVFGVSTTPAVKIGWYEPGTPGNATDLFSIDLADAQTVNATPRGSTSFDPGSAAFSLYSIWPGLMNSDGTVRTLYQEDAFNTFDATDRRHIRFYPLKNSDGSVVPNSYIMAHEEIDAAKDNQDIVAIISNVTSAMNGAEIGIENLDGIPSPNRLSFNKFQQADPNHPDTASHTTAKIRIHNTGAATLTISSLAITGPFKVASPTTPISILAGKFADVNVQFTATATLGSQTGSLTINSSDADEPSKVITLSGFLQKMPEANVEPKLVQLGNDVLGYGTVFVYPDQNLSGGGKVAAVGDEVLSPYWVRVDNSLPVGVRQLASYHAQGDIAAVKWHNKGSTATTTLFTIAGVDAQTLFPRKDGNLSSVGQGTFRPAGTFGFRVDNEWSDDTKNPQEKTGGGYGHHVRFYAARDNKGTYLPNTFIMTMDYNGINYDYNDNIYLITNVRSEKLPSAPAGVSAFASGAGVQIDWGDTTDAGVTGWNVFRSTKGNSGFKQITSTPVTISELLDKTAVAGTKYYYRVIALAGSNQSIPGSASATA